MNLFSNGSRCGYLRIFNRALSAKSHTKRHQADNTGSSDIGWGGYALAAGDNGKAGGELEAKCGSDPVARDGDDSYSIVGISVVHYCDYLKETNQCFASEAVDISLRVTSWCCVNTGGWNYVLARSYGRRA